MTLTRHEGTFRDAPIVGATATFYPDMRDPRFEISLDNATRWQESGLPLVIVDGSPEGENASPETIRKAYEHRGATVLRSVVNGIASQRQQGARYILAQGGEKLVTHEPEKPDTAENAETVADALDGDTDIVIVGRTPESLASMPSFQRTTEMLAGWVLEKTLHLPSDALAGPRGYSARGAAHLLNYPSDQPGMNNWIYMYQTPLAAMAEGRGVAGVAANLVYPKAMVEQEEGSEAFDRKRYDQFRLQLEHLFGTYEVDPAVRHISTRVLSGLATLPEQPTSQQYKDYFAELETSFSEFGYRPFAQ